MKKLLLLVSFLIVSASAFANYFVFAAPVTVTVTGTSTQILAKNSLRTYLIIVNNGAVPVIVKFGSVQTAGEGISIPAGGNYEPYKTPSNSVYAETASSTASVTIMQGQ